MLGIARCVIQISGQAAYLCWPKYRHTYVTPRHIIEYLTIIYIQKHGDTFKLTLELVLLQLPMLSLKVKFLLQKNKRPTVPRVL